MSWVCCLFVAQEPSVVVERGSEQKSYASLARRGRFSIVTIRNRQSRRWRGGACVFSSRSVVVVARVRSATANESARRTHIAQIILFFFACWRARSCGGALLMACARCSALCARLGVVCATWCCVRGSTLCALRLALCSVFFVCITARHGCISLPCKLPPAAGSSLLRLK